MSPKNGLVKYYLAKRYSLLFTQEIKKAKGEFQEYFSDLNSFSPVEYYKIIELEKVLKNNK